MGTGTAFFAGVSVLVILIPVVAVAGTVALVVYGQRRSKARLAVLGRWAASTGWLLTPWDWQLPRRWDKSPFGEGSGRCAREVLSGRWNGVPAMSFTYTFTTGSGDDEKTESYHVITIALPTALPELTLTRRVFGIGHALSFESVDFNRTWHVHAAETKYAYDVITPRLMERLLQRDALDVGLRIDGPDLMCWTPGETKIEALASRLALLATIRDAVPAFVYQDHGYDPGNG